MKRVKKKKNLYICPVCQQAKYSTDMDKCLTLLHAYNKKQNPPYYKSFKKDLIYSFSDEDLDWACDDCFAKDKAIAAIPELIFDSQLPHLAHFDSDKACDRCGEAFIFSKTEKKFWYEKLQFHADAQPKNCKACRKIVRAEKKDNSRLSELMSQEKPLTKKELEEIATIYDRMGKEEKRRMYEHLAKRYKGN